MQRRVRRQWSHLPRFFRFCSLYSDTSDINACVAQPCGLNTVCTDLPAPSFSRTCACAAGFEGNPETSCTGLWIRSPCSLRRKEIDGCQSLVCGSNAYCRDLPPPSASAECLCSLGLSGDPYEACQGWFEAFAF
jgi:hypothetical protein